MQNQLHGNAPIPELSIEEQELLEDIRRRKLQLLEEIQFSSQSQLEDVLVNLARLLEFFGDTCGCNEMPLTRKNCASAPLALVSPLAKRRKLFHQVVSVFNCAAANRNSMQIPDSWFLAQY
ncbi:hypothetical protein CAPTEDRAFT_212975 [Capitella teleta]|uniref:Uncharacterized protein n=1 Tax=Capitella teleta TaxID=283909 RepID=R7UHS2_CAPTE|nr:hypothetical protein CAPTEDRAFT_212975 [Capitella teleta]|eukprot:ELU02827.1 hypothetical protein CAPTEDRAFT_212975 [Capitella teleta]